MLVCKRLVFLMLAFILLACSLSVSCKTEQTELEKISQSEFLVTYIDVGEGNSVLVRFPDGKTLLYDCGSQAEKVYKNVKDVLISLNVSKIDYLILSHPDEQHIGGAQQLLDDFIVAKVYLPCILFPQDFPIFNATLTKINNMGIKYCYPEVGHYESGSDYAFAFLTPDLVLSPSGAYSEFNAVYEPTDELTNDLSPIVYIEYAGVRFILTGDATATQEKFLLQMYFAGQYSHYYEPVNINVKLNDIEFLMLADGGDSSSSCADLLQVVKPKNAVISVGGNNTQNHPSSSALSRLFDLNPYCNLYRTDVYGNISVIVSKTNGYEIITSLNK